jgi:hypothetical protein
MTAIDDEIADRRLPDSVRGDRDGDHRLKDWSSRLDLRLKGVRQMNAKLVTTPGGEKLAILPAEEYEDMCDALAHATAMDRSI